MCLCHFFGWKRNTLCYTFFFLFFSHNFMFWSVFLVCVSHSCSRNWVQIIVKYYTPIKLSIMDQYFIKQHPVLFNTWIRKAKKHFYSSTLLFVYFSWVGIMNLKCPHFLVIKNIRRPLLLSLAHKLVFSRHANKWAPCCYVVYVMPNAHPSHHLWPPSFLPLVRVMPARPSKTAREVLLKLQIW